VAGILTMSAGPGPLRGTAAAWRVGSNNDAARIGRKRTKKHELTP
jgi:hypothetical protein